MNKASLLLFSLSSSLIASSVLAQSSWTDMGEYWGNPFPPRWISHKMITLTNCKIQSESPKVKRCSAGSLGLGETYSERYYRTDGTSEIYIYFNEIDEKQKAWKKLEQYAIQGETVPFTTSYGKGWFSRKYTLMDTRSYQIDILIPNYNYKFETVLTQLKDPKNAWVRFDGLTFGKSTEIDFLKHIKSKYTGSIYKDDFVPPEFDSDDPETWYSSKYVTGGKFWGLPGEQSSTIIFGDFGLLDKLYVTCKGEGVYDKLVNRFAKNYKLTSQGKGKASFQPKSDACREYSCPEVHVTELGEYIIVAMFGNASYIGDGNYKFKWYEKKFARSTHRRKQLVIK